VGLAVDKNRWGCRTAIDDLRCRETVDVRRPSTLDQVRQHLVGLKMPRVLEGLDHTMHQLDHVEIGALKAIDDLLGEELTLREGTPRQEGGQDGPR